MWKKKSVALPAARISSIERVEANQVAIPFNTTSNWTCAVQEADESPPGWAGTWSNLFVVPARPVDDRAEFVDTVTNRQKFYRLLLSQ